MKEIKIKDLSTEKVYSFPIKANNTVCIGAFIVPIREMKFYLTMYGIKNYRFIKEE